VVVINPLVVYLFSYYYKANLQIVKLSKKCLKSIQIEQKSKYKFAYAVNGGNCGRGAGKSRLYCVNSGFLPLIRNENGELVNKEKTVGTPKKVKKIKPKLELLLNDDTDDDDDENYVNKD